MSAIIYFGELALSIAPAAVLLTVSTLKFSTAIVLFCCDVVAWTLAEYITHRSMLHAIAPVIQHSIHHARRHAIDRPSGK